MNNIVMQLYKSNNITKPVKAQKIAPFERSTDIAAEFELWITEKTYKENNAVVVEGYNAKTLS